MKEKANKDWKIKNGRIIECIIEKCKEKSFAQGYCLKHYDQNNRRKF